MAYTILSRDTIRHRFDELDLIKVHICADTAAELPSADEVAKKCFVPGSTAKLINDGSDYMLNHASEWVIQPATVVAAGGSGESGETTPLIPEDFEVMPVINDYTGTPYTVGWKHPNLEINLPATIEYYITDGGKVVTHCKCSTDEENNDQWEFLDETALPSDLSSMMFGQVLGGYNVCFYLNKFYGLTPIKTVTDSSGTNVDVIAGKTLVEIAGLLSRYTVYAKVTTA